MDSKENNQEFILDGFVKVPNVFPTSTAEFQPMKREGNIKLSYIISARHFSRGAYDLLSNFMFS